MVNNINNTPQQHRWKKTTDTSQRHPDRIQNQHPKHKPHMVDFLRVPLVISHVLLIIYFHGFSIAKHPAIYKGVPPMFRAGNLHHIQILPDFAQNHGHHAVFFFSPCPRERPGRPFAAGKSAAVPRKPQEPSSIALSLTRWNMIHIFSRVSSHWFSY